MRSEIATVRMGFRIFAFALSVTMAASPVPAQVKSTNADRSGSSAKLLALAGIYKIVPSAEPLPHGLRRSGRLDDLPLTLNAQAAQKSANLSFDGAKNCQAIGPFRMLAREGTEFELVPFEGNLVIFFENTALGNMQEIHLNRKEHPATAKALWLGDSVGRWDGDNLVVDTTGFNTLTWLNDAGAPHSDRLHLITTFRLLEKRQYIEVMVTAEDSSMLQKPFTYVRIYKKVSREMAEDFCEGTDSPGDP